jgi:hypothetical protein
VCQLAIHVTFRDSYYKGEPDRAAVTHHLLCTNAYMLAGLLARDGQWS